ncbi:MAG: hypothetical protein RIT03_439 [Bacteroidota bacterium]|jgi:hypothetical protein
MKKIAMLFVMLLGLGSFYSCSSDKKEDPNSSSEKLVGTWKWVGDWTDGEYDAGVFDDCDREILQFNAGGTFTDTQYNCGSAPYVENGTWTKSSDNQYLTTTSFGSITAFTVFTENNTKVTVYRSFQDIALQTMGAVYVRQ